MDYMFFIPNWYSSKAPFREHSMLTNPRVPAEVLASRRAVYVGDAGGGEREAGAAVLPPAPTGADVEAVLGGLGEVRVLELRQPLQSLCTVDDAAAVDARMKTVIHGGALVRRAQGRGYAMPVGLRPADGVGGAGARGVHCRVKCIS